MKIPMRTEEEIIAEKQEQKKIRRTAEIKAKLIDIDFKTARAGRRVAIGLASEDDFAFLRKFEMEAEALREELKRL